MSNVRQALLQLTSAPLAGLSLTLGVYAGCHWIYRRSGLKPILNPVFSAALILVVLLLLSGVEYEAYFRGAQFIDFLLGPAVVALAVPLFTVFDKMREATLPIAVAVLTGAITAAGSAVGIAWLCGASAETVRSIASKSVTAPVAMSIAHDIGGVPSLTAVFVILTGMLGAAVATWTLDLVGIEDPKARGLAIGVTAHGQGTALALQVDATSGAFAGLGMGLTALASAALLPTLAKLLW
jgi:predicted murein hydrolase (TIGR00659 family)